MAKNITQLTETTTFSNTDLFYMGIDPAGSPLDRKATGLAVERYLPMPQSAITGLALANNVTDANNDIDIAVGRVGAGTGDYNLILTSARIKQLDAVWAVGTNQGGLDTGSKANSTWYHVWLIGRVDTHVVDVLFSTSVSAPTMPTNYTKKRRIGAIRTDSSGNLIPFLQYGDDFWWKSPPFLDIDDATLTTTKKNYTLSGVPGGLVVESFLNVRAAHATGSVIYVSNPNLTDLAASATATPLGSTASVNASGLFIQMKMITDASAQISARASGSSSTIRVVAIGWRDPRGKW